MDDDDKPDVAPGPEVERLFATWRSPRFGKSNPEKMNNPVWEWVIRSRVNAFQANERFKGPSPFEAGPAWCFDRFGQSQTALADGRMVFIAGEHEDSYDPDFHIYNDVVVQNPNGTIDIYGYPKEDFPPTDFHTATLVEDRIIVVGSLGNLEERKPGMTPVFELDLSNFKISELKTAGTPPGWIHKHSSALRSGNLEITGGLIETGIKGEGFVENIDDWRLRLETLTWERATRRVWQQWEFCRADGKMNNLWKIRSAEMMRNAGLSELHEKMEKESVEKYPWLAESLKVPKTSVAELYRPSVPHETIAQKEEEHNVFRVKVNGITVRFVEEMHWIKMVIEGELDEAVVERLREEVAEKLTRAEETPYRVRRVG